MENKEKRLRKTASIIGFFLFLMVVIEVILFLYVDRFLNIISLTRARDAQVKIFDIMIYLLVPVSIFYLLLMSSRSKISDVVNFKYKKCNLFKYILISFFGSMIANVITYFLINILKSTHISSPSPNFYYGSSAMSIFLSIIEYNVVPAIAEEFVFRGVILNELKPYGGKFAVVASSLLFALLHGNIEQFLFAFLLGLYFGYIALQEGSIVPTVIIHFLNNFLVGISTLFKSNEEISAVLSAVYLVLSIISLVYILYFALKNILKVKFKVLSFFKKSSADNNFKLSDKWNAFIFNPGMALFIMEVLALFYFSLRAI
ncbi:MAG: CPBP family intramembrane metalloprotease [Clostridia bacterium]|nr:CPBP family intramembrane metalloprotease [Clostridia bacterium]